MIPVQKEEIIEIETFESEYKGWKLTSWAFYGVWYVTAELFDRVTLRHGLCHGKGPTREMAEMLAMKKIDKNESVKWVYYVMKSGGHLEVLRKETT